MPELCQNLGPQFLGPIRPKISRYAYRDIWFEKLDTFRLTDYRENISMRIN